MKTLLLLGAGILQLAVIKKAKELGVYTIVADGNPDAIGLPLADMPIVVNITNPDAVLNSIKNIKIDGVIHPCSEVAMNTLGVINDKFNLSGIGLEKVKIATNKAMMRYAFKNGGAPSPISFGAFNFEEFLGCLKSINEDAIVKPSRNSGSRGVARINKGDSQEIMRVAFDEALKNSRDNGVVVEQYIEGPEFSVEIVIFNGIINVLTVTDKITTGPPHFVELGHSQPSVFSTLDVDTIKEAAIKGCVAMGLDNCVAHAEVKLKDGKAYLMEIGARLGGDFISTELVHLSTGIDMAAAAIQIALGQQPDLKPHHPPRGAAIRYFVPNKGYLRHLDISNCKKFEDGIYQMDVYCKVGDYIHDILSSSDRSGHVITVGESVEEAIEIANKVIQSINYISE